MGDPKVHTSNGTAQRTFEPIRQGSQSFLIWGGNGWIAGHLYELLTGQGKRVSTTTARMEDRERVMEVLASVRPTHVLNCAGCTGRPNVDWCEDNKQATIRSNVIGTLNLTDCCFLLGIHITVFATGFPIQHRHLQLRRRPSNRRTWLRRNRRSQLFGSFYSTTKSATESLLTAYPNSLVLRLRMPVSDDLHPRSFVAKITSYARICSIENSHTILHDLLPCAILLASHHETGVYNFTNPGTISHNDVLALFQKHVRPSFTWKNFSLEEQSRIVKAGRSNCALDTSKLVAKMKEFGVAVPEVHEAYEQCFQRMSANGTK